VATTWKDTSGQEITRIAQIPSSAQPNTGILGVTITNVSPGPEFVLSRYKSAFGSNPIAILLPPTMAEGSVPYSNLMASKYSSSMFGSYFPVAANFLFWLWFININAAIFNSLPINHLPGGRIYNQLIQTKMKTKPAWIVKTVTASISIIMILLVIVTL
jgi:membrane-associated protease RseP (regulator of RpoE activity)